MQLRAGCDPGYANLGFNWLDVIKKKSFMAKINLKRWDGKEHDLNIADIGPCVYEFCVAHKKYFDATSEFAVEHLPEQIGNKTTNYLVRDVMTSMCQTIHILYPHIRIYYVSPMTMKAFTNTSGARSHAESKKRTSECSILPPDQMLIAVEKFEGRSGKLQVDPIDATIASMLLDEYKGRMITSRYHIPGVIREFEKVVMTSSVVYPDKLKPARKRIAKKTTKTKKTKKQPVTSISSITIKEPPKKKRKKTK
jgi:hypothetical protein